MKKTGFIAMSVLMASLASGASAADKFKQGDAYFSREQLAQFGPVRIELKDGHGFEIRDLSLPEEPNRNCRLDIKSLSRMVTDRWGTLEPDSVTRFELQAHNEGNGEPICSNGGKGCVVILKLF